MQLQCEKNAAVNITKDAVDVKKYDGVTNVKPPKQMAGPLWVWRQTFVVRVQSGRVPWVSMLLHEKILIKHNRALVLFCWLRTPKTQHTDLWKAALTLVTASTYFDDVKWPEPFCDAHLLGVTWNFCWTLKLTAPMWKGLKTRLGSYVSKVPITRTLHS